ncbi:MAG TPA: hypothetical protein VGH13_06910 [Xanthobacteraceae bacterium]|jgi:hypothetical protein
MARNRYRHHECKIGAMATTAASAFKPTAFALQNRHFEAKATVNGPGLAMKT